MSEVLDIWDKPAEKEVYLLAGWRQWVDAGSISSGLPRYLARQTKARKIGEIKPDPFYLFQFPGTHDLVRPIIRFNEGYPESLDTKRNEFFYSGDGQRGLVFFIGDEPHLNIEEYVQAILSAAKTFNVRRIVLFGGIYGELPYDKERIIHSIYSMKSMKEEISSLAVNLSSYHGGGSIGSYLARRAGEQEMELAGFYTFSPAYHFGGLETLGNTITIENDYMAWLGVMRRVNHFLGIRMDLDDLEAKSQQLIEMMDAKIEELDKKAPQLGVREYVQQLSDEFTEFSFNPLEDVWEEELRRLEDKLDSDEA
jgi:proteasome assembly chaperone (PAC2) family protein